MADPILSPEAQALEWGRRRLPADIIAELSAGPPGPFVPPPIPPGAAGMVHIPGDTPPLTAQEFAAQVQTAQRAEAARAAEIQARLASSAGMGSSGQPVFAPAGGLAGGLPPLSARPQMMVSGSTSTTESLRMTPEQRRLLAEAQQAGMGALEAQQAALPEQARIEQEAVAQARTAAIDEKAEARARRQALAAQMAQRAQEIDTETTALSKAAVDPERFWANKSTGSKIFAVIASAIGGAGAALAKMGSNPVLDAIDKRIDADIASQRDQLGRRERGLGRNESEYGRLQARSEHADELYRLAGQKSVLTMLEETRARALNPLTAARLAQLGADYKGRIAEQTMALAPKTRTTTQRELMGARAGAGAFAGIDPSTPEGQALISRAMMAAAHTPAEAGAAAKTIGEMQRAGRLSPEAMSAEVRRTAATESLSQLEKLREASPVASAIAQAPILGPLAGIVSPSVRDVRELQQRTSQNVGYLQSGANVPEMERQVIQSYLTGRLTREGARQRIAELRAQLGLAPPVSARPASAGPAITGGMRGR